MLGDWCETSFKQREYIVKGASEEDEEPRVVAYTFNSCICQAEAGESL